MIASFILFLSLASAMSAPATPKDGALSALANPTPSMLEQLTRFSDALKATSSLAATSPERPTQVSSLANQPANLNIPSALNNVITQVATSVIDRLLPGSSPQAAPANFNPSGPNTFGTGNGVGFGTGTGTGFGTSSSGAVNPRVRVVRRRNPFNPLRSLFSGGSNPFSMFSPSNMMLGEMMENFMEFF